MSAPAGAGAAAPTGFESSRASFEALLGLLGGESASVMSHSERVTLEGRELLRQLLQDHLDLRAERERRIAVVTDAEGLGRGAVEAGHRRALASVFGDLEVRRLAYRAHGAGNLHPADALLNLPVERHSHGLRRLAALEASRGSFEDALAAVARATGQALGKRQAGRAAGRQGRGGLQRVL